MNHNVIGPPATGVADLNLDQPVFHSSFGYGTVTGIEDDNITFSSKKDSTVSHTVKALELLTRPQAEVGLETCYFSGGAKAWRRAAGRWASLYKNLCLMEGKGTYGDWLKLHDVSRSSIDDLVRRFEDEATWAAQDLILTESGNTDQTNPAPETAASIYSVTGARKDNERTRDAENETRQKNIEAEISKRKNVKPTYHKTILYLQRRNLDPEKLGRYYAIRENAKAHVDAIMRRKIDEGIDEVLALAPAAPTTQPEVTPSPAIEKNEPATSAMPKGIPATGAPEVNDRGTDVRSACLNMGFRRADVKQLSFGPGLSFDQMMRQALKQLRPMTEKEGETCTF
jgi:hypothetical protein